MDELPLPDLISPAEMAAAQVLGEQVRQILARTGLPTFYQPNFREPPENSPGAHVGIEPMVAGQVNVDWASTAELTRAAMDESREGDFTGPAVLLSSATAFAMGEAIVRIVRAAGLDAGLGVDMDPSAVWIKRPA